MIGVRLLFLTLMVVALFALLTEKFRNQLGGNGTNGAGNVETLFHTQGDK